MCLVWVCCYFIFSATACSICDIVLKSVILVFPVMRGLICDVLFLLFFVFDVLFFSKGTSWMRSRLRNTGRRLNWSYRTSVMMLWEWLMSTLSLRLQLVNPLCFTIRCEDLCLILCHRFCFGVIYFLFFILCKWIKGCWNVLLAGKEIIIVILLNLSQAMRKRKLMLLVVPKLWIASCH